LRQYAQTEAQELAAGEEHAVVFVAKLTDASDEN